MAKVESDVADRADGNPLYARYLARGLIAGIQDATITTPEDWIAVAPLIAGDVAAYYAYLYRSASAQAQAIADLVGVIDFAVTEGELREMLPVFVGAWVPDALSVLAPILTAATGQGGVRVFHESFRRFMTEELSRQGRSPADALEPVIRWLDGRGLFRDAKAYRFLLPALRRARRNAEVLDRVSITFVSDSVAAAHPLDPIQRNLALFADVAARMQDWPALVRGVELHRAAYTCFDESQNSWRDYWATFLALFGPTALAERLLFDGRPTQARSDGLYACALIDDADGTAPWREYLDLWAVADSDAYGAHEEYAHLNPQERDALAVVQGRLRLGQRMRILRRLLRQLYACNQDCKPLFIRGLVARLARMSGTALVERIACRADPAWHGGPRMTARTATMVLLGLADEYARTEQRAQAADAATRALEGADTPELAAACLDLGASGRYPSLVAIDPHSLPIAVGPDDHLHDAKGVRAWVASIRLLATDPNGSADALAAQWRRVDGVGWYRCWLRFVIALARAETALRAGEAADLAGAFAELTQDVHPWRGKPRPCDLFYAHGVIQETLAWGFSLMRSEAEWRTAIDAVLIAASGTGSRLDREDGGPIPTGALLDLLTPYATDPVAGALVRDAIERALAQLDAGGTYYSTHADYTMRLARVRHAGGQEAAALEAWSSAAVFLVGYGWRKDITVFDVIDSAPALVAVSPESALKALADVQSLANAVLTHTDGRSTNHAPNAWLRNLLRVAPTIGIALLARTIVEEEGTG